MDGIVGMESKSVTDTPLTLLPEPIDRSVRATLANSASRSVSDAVRRMDELRLGAMTLLPERPSGTTRPWLEIAPSSEARELCGVRCDAMDPERMEDDRPENESGRSGMESSGGT